MKDRFLVSTYRRAFSLAMLLFGMVAPASAEEAWLLKQDRRTEKLEVIVTSKAVKMSLPDRGWHAIATAPDWTIRTYNTKSKLKCDIPYKQWIQLAVIDRFTDALDVYEHADRLKILSSVVEGKGITARHVITYKSNNEYVGGKAWHGVSSVNKKIDDEKPELVKTYTCIYAAGIGSEQVNKILCALNITPPGKGGVPLKYRANLQNGQTIVRLSTYSVAPYKVEKNTFVLPLGLVKAGDPRQVSCAMDQQGLHEMMTDFGLGRPLGAESKDLK
jgi:hypothetical protein